MAAGFPKHRAGCPRSPSGRRNNRKRELTQSKDKQTSEIVQAKLLINLRLLRKGLQVSTPSGRTVRRAIPSTSAATVLLCCYTAAPGAVFLLGSLSCAGCESRSQQSEKEQHLLFPQTKPCLASTRTGWSLWWPPSETLSLCSHWHHVEHWQELCPAELPPSSSKSPAKLLCCSTAKHSTAQSRISLCRERFILCMIGRFTKGDEAQFPQAKEICEGEELK